MNKLYDRVDWVNNTTPALNQTNLNKMSKALDDLDDRVVDIAGTVMEVVPEIQEDLTEAAELVQDAEAITTHPPIIGQNGNWWTWDTSIDAYADSGIDAGVSLTVGSTTTLPAGSSATVTNTGTATDPVLNFGIPQGAAGQNGTNGQDGADGVSPAVTIGSITGGHSVTITDKDHPSGQSFNVMDGAAGVGVPSGGTTGQVLQKASNTDYDAEWTTPSGGSGGHTILNDSGTSMTQQPNLQFKGLSVSNDGTNSKTVVEAPTPDYVDEQYSSSKTYTIGQTCIYGNKRYRYINSNATSGNQPPNATYWVEESVVSEITNNNLYFTDSNEHIIAKVGNEVMCRRYVYAEVTATISTEVEVALPSSITNIETFSAWLDPFSHFRSENTTYLGDRTIYASNTFMPIVYTAENAYLKLKYDSSATQVNKLVLKQSSSGGWRKAIIHAWINYIRFA